MTHPARTGLTKLLPNLKEGEWDYLVRKNFVSEYDKGFLRSEELRDEVLEIREATTSAKSRGGRSSEPQLLENPERRDYYEAVSELIAREAGELEAVKDFRRTHLRNRLIQWHQIEAWVEKRVEKPTHWIHKPVNGSGGPITHSVNHVSYITHTPQLVRVRPTTLGGALEELRGLAEDLSTRFGWTEPQAATWVLTGITALLEPIRWRYTSREPSAASRVEITLNPTVTPKELANWYAAKRKVWLGKRTRRITEKHQRLALFLPEGQDDSTWRIQMNEWNAANTKDRYYDYRVFRRDVLAARERLLNPISE